MNCDRLASVYQVLEYGAFGPALWKRRVAFLDLCLHDRRVLMAGEGDGRFLRSFLAANPGASIDAIDLSRRMLTQARRRAGAGAKRVRFLQADAAQASLPRGAYDLIVTHFFLDFFDEDGLAQLVGNLSGAGAPEARWLISEFRVPEAGVMRPIARALLAVLYAFFRLAVRLETRRLPEHGAALTQQGFVRTHYQESWGGLLVSELWQRTGAGGKGDTNNPL